MKNFLFAVGSVGILAAGGIILLNLGGDVAEEISPAPEAVVWLKGDCAELKESKCIKIEQFDDRCACYVASKDELVDEAFDATKETADEMYQLMWCKDNVMWARMSEADKFDKCQIIIDKMPIDKSISYETEIEKALSEICVPCKVNPLDWGPCPHCLYDSKKFPGGCAEACKEDIEKP